MSNHWEGLDIIPMPLDEIVGDELPVDEPDVAANYVPEHYYDELLTPEVWVQVTLDVGEDEELFEQFIDTLCHEILHDVLCREIDYETCVALDIIGGRQSGNGYVHHV